MMKKALFAVLACGVMAVSAHADIKIGGNNSQKVNVQNGAVANMAIGAGASAKQNLASNKGNVKIGGNNNQEVSVKNGAVANMAIGAGTKAEQNLASNDGTK